MKASLFAFMVVGLASAPGAFATIIRNDYHISGSFNESGSGITQVWTTLPNSSSIASVDVDYVPDDELFEASVNITFPMPREGSNILAAALFASGTVTWAEDTMYSEPIVSDCNGQPCPHNPAYAIGFPQQIALVDPLGGYASPAGIVHYTPDLAGKTFDLKVLISAPSREVIGGAFNSKTTYTLKGPASYSVDITAITEYTHAPEPSSVALFGLAGAALGWGLYRSRKR